jgi:hypothetical protein
MSVELWKILNDLRTANNVREMYRFGTEEYRETAFAVYRFLGGYAVSELLVPQIASTDLLDELRDGLHTGIDTEPLTHHTVDDNTIWLYDKELYEADEAIFSDATRQIIERINAEPHLDEASRNAMKEAIISRELKLAKPSPGARQDLLLLAHNHPLIPYALEKVDILSPSQQDVRHTERLLQKNPGIIEAIVMSDTENQAMFLYAGNPQRSDRQPQRYSGTEARDSKRAIALLNKAGYLAITFPLTKNGRPRRNQRETIESFAKAVTSMSKS